MQNNTGVGMGVVHRLKTDKAIGKTFYHSGRQGIQIVNVDVITGIRDTVDKTDEVAFRNPENMLRWVVRVRWGGLSSIAPDAY